MISIDDFKRELIENDVGYINDTYVTNISVWYFNGKYNHDSNAQYQKFKSLVANQLGTAAANIAIVGSAKIGFSLSPTKNFKEFHAESDIDLVVVSSDLFRRLWQSYYIYINNTSAGVSYSRPAKNIFKHFISIKDNDITAEMYPYFEWWISMIGNVKRSIEIQFGIVEPINYRVYEDWNHVNDYHISGLKQIKLSLSEVME